MTVPKFSWRTGLVEDWRSPFSSIFLGDGLWQVPDVLFKRWGSGFIGINLDKIKGLVLT